MAVNRRTMAQNFWLQKLTFLSLLVAPVQSLQSSLSASPLVSCQFTASGRIGPWSREGSNENNAHYIRQIHNKRQHRYPFSLFSSRNEVETDEDFDEFMDELFEESIAASTSVDESKAEGSPGQAEKKGKESPHFMEGELTEELLKESVAASTSADESEAKGSPGEAEEKGEYPPHFIVGETAIGIGGNDGFVYDLNALKRNLVQESVRGCKQELLVLLGDGRQNQAIAKKSTEDGKQLVVTPRWRRDRDDLIEDRLSALVQTNPVSTTTDSNLLDGEWSFAFATNSASTILDTSRFLLSKTKRINPPADEMNETRGSPWRFRAGKTDNPFRSSTREIYLENLSGDENAHIVDETRVLGGIFQTSRRYDVFGLTRTAIDLDLMEIESKLFGIRIKGNSRDDFKGTAQGQPLEIQVLYLDTDLCICTTGAGLDGPLHVYTKNDVWVTGGAKHKLQLMAKTASWISTMQSPLRIRQRLTNFITEKNDNRPMETGPELKAVNIGELDINEDGTTREDAAWDGPDDPFLHLSPGERMEVLRTMSLQDIYQSALERKEQNKKQKKKWGGNRGKKFKRPDL